MLIAELRRKPALILCLSAGGTPTRTYELLAAKQERQPELFTRLRAVQIDEWAGLPAGSPGTCEEDLRTKVLGPLKVTPERYIRLASDAANLEAECERMNRWLAANGPIDVCILGLGKNGHIAMNEPAEELLPEAHVSTLAATSRNHPMLKEAKRRPRFGLTLGVGDILKSRKILLLASGWPKRAIHKRVLKPRVTTRCPASMLWLHPNVTVLGDRAAAGILRD